MKKSLSIICLTLMTASFANATIAGSESGTNSYANIGQRLCVSQVSNGKEVKKIELLVDSENRAGRLVVTDSEKKIQAGLGCAAYQQEHNKLPDVGRAIQTMITESKRRPVVVCSGLYPKGNAGVVALFSNTGGWIDAEVHLVNGKTVTIAKLSDCKQVRIQKQQQDSGGF